LKGGYLEARIVLIHDGEIFVALSAKRVATTNTYGAAAPLMRNVAGRHKVVDRGRQKPRLMIFQGLKVLLMAKQESHPLPPIEQNPITQTSS